MLRLPGRAQARTARPPTSTGTGRSQDTPIQDDVCLDEYNVEQRIDAFVRACEEMANVTRGNDIMLTMGTDFQYSNAFVWCAAGMLQRQVKGQAMHWCKAKPSRFCSGH